MEWNLALALPRDELSIPIARRACSESLRILGVLDQCRQDIEVALSEACTNVLNHADANAEYEVGISIDDRHCTIEVRDVGAGFDPAQVVPAHADGEAEGGRGIQLMRSLVDSVDFMGGAHDGTVVRLEKALEFATEAPFIRLATAATTAHQS